jgi:hypothetical protein
MQQNTTDEPVRSADQDPVLRMVNKSLYKQNRERQTAYNDSMRKIRRGPLWCWAAAQLIWL